MNIEYRGIQPEDITDDKRILVSVCCRQCLIDQIDKWWDAGVLNEHMITLPVVILVEALGIKKEALEEVMRGLREHTSSMSGYKIKHNKFQVYITDGQVFDRFVFSELDDLPPMEPPRDLSDDEDYA